MKPVIGLSRVLRRAFEPGDLTLVIGVVLKKATDYGSYSQARSERRIALVADPAEKIFGLQYLDGSLEFL